MYVKHLLDEAAPCPKFLPALPVPALPVPLSSAKDLRTVPAASTVYNSLRPAPKLITMERWLMICIQGLKLL